MGSVYGLDETFKPFANIYYNEVGQHRMNNAFVITPSIPFLVFVFLPIVWSTSQLPGDDEK
jgi:hypothetical protein